MRKVEINVYKFDELEKDIQEKLIKVQEQDDYQFYLDYDLEYDMNDIAQNLLKETFKGTHYVDTFYDLSYTQGSGAMIEFNIDLRDINNAYKMLSENEIKQIENIGYTDIKIRHISDYCGARSFDVDYQDYTFYIDNFDDVQDKLDDMMIKFESDIRDMNSVLTKKGYALLEDFPNRDVAIFNLRENEYFKDGTVFEFGFANINDKKESD